MSGWQQDAWNKSYEHKKKTGISLIKEKALKQKKGEYDIGKRLGIFDGEKIIKD